QELPAGAVAHDAARGAHLRPRLRLVERCRRQLANLPDGLRAVEPLAPRVDPEGLDLTELCKPDFGKVLGFASRVGWSRRAAGRRGRVVGLLWGLVGHGGTSVVCE